MFDKVENYIEKDIRYKKLLKSIIDNPYTEKKVFFDGLNIEIAEGEELLDCLTKDLIVLELTCQQGSNIESRVPKKIYIINPEIEDEIFSLLQ